MRQDAPERKTALDGVSVVEFGCGVAVGYCGALLAACGAEVIKIEPPGLGDSVRHLPPFAAGVAAPEASGLHAFLSANKLSCVLDLDTPEGAEQAAHLAETADIVVEALGPGKAEALGLADPHGILVSLSWFGSDGRRRDWAGSDAIVQALAGFLYPIGSKDGPPQIPGGYQAQITGGLTAFVAAMTALIGGGGAHIDQSILEAQTTYTENAGVRLAYDGSPSVRKGLNCFEPTYPQTIYPAADGWIGVTALTPPQWRACCELIGAPELADDPRFTTPLERCGRAEELDAILAPLFRKRPALAWFHEGQARRIPFALVPTMADLANLDHFQARDLLARYEHPDVGSFSAATIPWKLTATPLRRGGMAPQLGEHTEMVLGRIGTAPGRCKALPAEAPLHDIRIVDLTMGWSGPLATRHLADMGAEVIKIESCGHPDWWRGWERTAESLATQEHEKSAIFNHMNRNKLGVAIDLARAEGRALALKLVARADAVIENQATGVMAKLGLSYNDLRQVNPQIVMLSLPAFGAVGPWSGYRGYGSTVEQSAGLPHLTGAADGPPLQTHVAYGDACGGLNAAAALLLALYHRARSGEGQRLEISQVECMLQQGVHGTIAQGLSGAPPARTGNRHPLFVPHGCFACAAPDSWLVVAVTEDAQWAPLCAVIDRPDLAELTPSERRTDEESVEAAISAWAATMDADAAMGALQAASVPAAAVRRSSDLLHDPAFVERGFWREIERDVVGVKPHPLTPWRYNGDRAELRSPAPLLGEHNRAVLCDILGLSEKELAVLAADAIIGDTPIVR
jgi:crotonobetainyl-CoA:carnitine CoA-transferase CaiB-like acyl-CoA transferase